MTKIIDSRNLYYAYLSGAKNVMRNKNNLNKINVFPVADGDTGSNLFLTMNSIIKESKLSESVKHTLESIANASLRGARGNSGVIISQFLNGLSIEMSNDTTLSIESFTKANLNAVKYAYSAIANPVEGTMITVIKDWAHSLHEFHHKANDFLELLNYSYSKLEESLKNTQKQLHVLKKAGVVDSGAKGFLLFIKGFLDSFKKGNSIIDIDDIVEDNEIVLNQENYSHEEIKYRYCTEAMIEGEDIDQLSIKQKIIGFGDSLIVAGNNKTVRIHIHTDFPSKVFEEINEFGKITYQKVEDMVKQKEIVHNRKHDIALVTDSIADLPRKFIDENQIHVISLNIIIDDENYLDKLTISNKKILDKVKTEGKYPTSSQPDYKTVQNLFLYLLTYYKSIIVVTVSKELSGTFNIINKVAKEFREKGKTISVVNSKQNSGAEGLLVMKCAKEIEKGKNHEEILNNMNNYILKSKILVSIKTLDNLIKSGRLSTSAGKVAKTLNLNPIVSLDKDGKGILDGIAFSQKSSIKKIARRIRVLLKKNQIDEYSVVHVGNHNLALEYSKTLTKIIGKAPQYIDETSSIVAMSSGEGCIGVSYILK